MRFLLIPALLVAALAVAVLDEDAGIRTWLRLRGDVRAAEARQETLRAEIAELRDEAEALESQRFAQERAIREELEWARPGETVVRLPPERPPGDAPSDSRTPRFP